MCEHKFSTHDHTITRHELESARWHQILSGTRINCCQEVNKANRCWMRIFPLSRHQSGISSTTLLLLVFLLAKSATHQTAINDSHNNTNDCPRNALRWGRLCVCVCLHGGQKRARICGGAHCVISKIQALLAMNLSVCLFNCLLVFFFNNCRMLFVFFCCYTHTHINMQNINKYLLLWIKATACEKVKTRTTVNTTTRCAAFWQQQQQQKQ